MRWWLHATAVGLAALPVCAQDVQLDCVSRPPLKGVHPSYRGNRAPLQPAPLLALPAGSIAPRGWLRRQLELMAGGFTGHLGELSRFLKKEGNAWLDPKGEGHSGWEEVPYWLRGFVALGVALNDERILAEARVWIEAALASQRPDGYFGPRSTLTRIQGAKPDVWPHMVMLGALRTWYEHSGDERIPALMKRFFRWQLGLADEDFLEPFWQNQRGGDNLALVLWLYNLCGEKWLLDLARKTHRNTAPWQDGIASWHGVNIAQGFREPAQFWQVSGDPAHLAQAGRNWRAVMDLYGRVPGGLFGADENCRPGFEGPRQAAETCTMVEMMLSCEMLLGIDGDPVWAERCEDVAFNSLPAAMTADCRALRYLSAPNMVRSDRTSKAPGLQNSGPMLEYNPHIHRCCQHNSGHGWPYFCDHLWYATLDGGLAALLYAPCEVRARAGAGALVHLAVRTRYPFRRSVEIEIGLEKPASFPLYLRVPGWCAGPALKLNGSALKCAAQPGSYLRLERRWEPGDRVTLELPMHLALRLWQRSGGMVAIQRGPLTYSLAIGTKKVRSGGTDAWPAWELLPTTAWNYGLEMNKGWPAGEVQVLERDWPSDEQPFTPRAAPIEIHLGARRIPQWKEDALGLVGPLQPSPARTSAPVERVRLIPMGCARLRIAAFPTVSAGAGRAWRAPRTPLRAQASHCFSGDTLTALSDGLLPKNSDDHSLPRFTWWPRKGAMEWVSYELEKPRKVDSVALYWFDDRPRGGGCRAPASWRLLYRLGEEWKPARPLAGERYGVARDRFNEVRLQPFTSAALRLEVQLQKGFSGGILEWIVRPPAGEKGK